MDGPTVSLIDFIDVLNALGVPISVVDAASSLSGVKFNSDINDRKIYIGSVLASANSTSEELVVKSH